MLTTLEVDLEVATRIGSLARERGVPVEVYLRNLIERKTNRRERQADRSSEERVRLLRQWAASHSLKTPILSSDAINRETIYSEQRNVPR